VDWQTPQWLLPDDKVPATDMFPCLSGVSKFGVSTTGVKGATMQSSVLFERPTEVTPSKENSTKSDFFANQGASIIETKTKPQTPTEIVAQLIQNNPSLLSLPYRESCGISDLTYTSLIATPESEESERDLLNQMVSNRFVMLVSTVEIITQAAQSFGVDAYDIFFPIRTDRPSQHHKGMNVVAKFVNRWSDIPFHYLDYAWDRALGRGLLEELIKQFESYRPRAFQEVAVAGNKVVEAVGELLSKYEKLSSLPKSRAALELKDSAEERSWVLVGIGALMAVVAGIGFFKAK